MTLDGVAFVIIIIEKKCFGVCFTGKLEGFSNELITAELIHGALAIRVGGIAVVRHSLIDNVPAVNDILIARYYSMDVVAHALIELLFCWVVTKHPTAYLGVPHKAVSTQFNSILTAEVGNAVGIIPIEFAFARLCGFGLHVVLTRHAVELTGDESLLLRISDIALIDSHTNHEIIFVGIFQALGIRRHTHEQQDERQEKVFN